MNEGEARPASVEGSISSRTEDRAAATSRRTGRTGLVLTCFLGLLILAGGLYYFAEHRAGTETGTRSEPPATQRPAAEATPGPVATAEKPAPAATPSQEPTALQTQPPQPNLPQQSAEATPPPPAPAPESSASVSAPATVKDPAPAEPPAKSAEVAPNVTQPAGSQASSPAEPMRQQPAALPDAPAVVPQAESMWIVKRGPANIRSAPGKAGRIIGTAPKNAAAKELDRSGNWVQVETEAGTGWISSGLLARQSTESR
jgi:hypothetical protein